MSFAYSPSLSTTMTDSESLSSPSPSPPPSNSRRKVDTIAKTAGLDSSSDLSELTEDEQDGLRDAAKTSTIQTINRGLGRRKRGGLVPAPMWDWAYKAPNKKIHEPDEDPSAGPSRLPDGADPDATPTNDDSDTAKENGREKQKSIDIPTNHLDGEGGEPLDEDERESEGGDADDNEDGDEDGDEDSLSDAKETREGSLLTEVDDVDDAVQEDDASVEDPTDADESAQSDDAEDDDDPPPAEQQNNSTDDAIQANGADTESVVPVAPSGSSIMAGQQIIKTPSPSPSPEPDEELPAAQPTTAADLDPDPEVEQDPELDAADADAAERADPDQDIEEAEADNEAEGEAEETELDLQPAHRAEALDVLAGIELRFSLLRERLYVEKMEDLAMEEAMILQGVHPEMTHLLNELQVRHDRRLELAAKKRRYEDEHVSLMRKVEEEGIWSWWKYERDQLQTDMFTESHRKRRRLEREKRGLERVMPVRRIPPPTAVHVHSKPLTVRDLVRSSTVDSHRTQPKLKRKRKEENGQILVYPTLSTLPLQDIQSDLQMITARRTYLHQIGPEIGPGIGIVPPPTHEGYEYNPGIGPPGHPHFGGLPPQSTSIYAPPPTTRSIYHHPPPPQSVSVIHQQTLNPRIMQGPGQLQHLHSNPGVPFPLGGYVGHGPRPTRRTPSPPPMQNYDHGPVNGVPPYATSGPGQHGWIPGTGPSKRPVVNGWQKESGRPPNGKDAAYDTVMREREGKIERDRIREREGRYYEGPNGEITDEQARIHSHFGPHSHQVQQPHRHTIQHQSLQGVPHHHHVVHHHRQPHHHHNQSRVPSSSAPSQHGGPPVRHEIERHNPPLPEHENTRRNVIEHINVQPKPPLPYWKTEEAEAVVRDRSRMMIGPNSVPPPPPPPPPPHERLQPTPFLMTPSHLSQTYPSSPNPRREPWAEEGPSRRPLPMEPSDLPQRHPPSQVSHQSRHVSSPQRQGLASPRRNGLPQGPPSSPPMSSIPSVPSNNHIHSPGSRRHTHSGIPSTGGSAHTSPHVNSSTPKMSRPISPLPVPPVPMKPLPSLYPHGPPSGPGTPGGMGSRLSTPGLAGPGTRPDIPPNGHPGSIPIYASPAQPLSGPGQPHLSPPAPEPSHILPAPPKMSVVQMGNGT